LRREEDHLEDLNMVVSEKVKSVPLQAPGAQRLRFPDIMTTAQDGGKVVILTHRPHLSAGNTPVIHFC